MQNKILTWSMVALAATMIIGTAGVSAVRNEHPPKKNIQLEETFVGGVELTAEPSPLPEGTDITISGTGFAANADLFLDFSHAPVIVTTDSDGAFSYTYDYSYYAPGVACVFVKDMAETELARECWDVVDAP